MTDFIFALFVR